MKTKLNGILTLLLAFVVQVGFAQQQQTIRGTVTDDTGMPLPGVNIVIQGTSQGVQTDFDGNYAIDASDGDVLVFSFLGLQTVEHVVDTETGTEVNIVMEPDAAQLDEVVVTALGIKRKRDEITTAYEVVDTEELNQANNPNVVNGLTGKVTGLQIQQTSTGVTGENRIVLRGNRSISGNNQALIVIDGAISTASFLESLDPNTIESLNVIKGANGAALYGSQGSNGVIVVTTKRGAGDQRMRINAKSTVDFESVAYVPERQTRYGQGWDLGQGYENIIYENGGWGPEFDGQMVPVGLPQENGEFIMAPYSTRGADNIRDFFETGTTFQNSVNISSGDEDGHVFFSAQNQTTDFVIENDRLQKSTFNFKGGKTLGRWTINGNATYSYTATNESFSSLAGDALYAQLLQTPSNVPIEAFENSGNEGHWNGYYMNPYWVRDNRRRERDVNRFNLLGEIEYTVNDNISAVLRTNGIFTFVDNLEFENAYSEPQSVMDITGYDRSAPSSFRFYNTNFQQYYTDFIVNFDYDLSEEFTFSANIGLNNQYIKNTYVGVGGNGLTVPGLYTSGNLSGTFNNADEITGDDRDARNSLGVFGNFTFGYNDYLFLNLTGRNDWTSVLAQENNSFFYPSAGLSFIPTKAFPELKSDILNYAKVSASYVQVGSQGPTGAYSINQVYVQAPGFPYDGLNSFVNPNTVWDPLLEPEFTNSWELGLNLGFLNDRVTLDLAYYNFTTDNQVTRISTSAASGLSGFWMNLGETQGYGAEIDLGLTPIRTDDFRWTMNFGYARNYTEVVTVSDQAERVSLGGYTGFAEVFAIEGEQFPTLMTTGYARDDQGRVIINQTTGLPEQSSEMVNMGNTTPDYILNLTTRFSYKGFTLAATMDYRTGHVFYSDTHNSMLWSGHAVETAQGGRGAFIFPNSSIQTAPATEDSPAVYEANTSVPTGGTTAGDYINLWNTMTGIGENSVFDATAFKLRELSLRYDLDPQYLEGTFISNLSISAIGRNLLTVLPAGNRGYNDPESNFSTGNAQGVITTGQYPPTRSIGLGVNLTF